MNTIGEEIACGVGLLVITVGYFGAIYYILSILPESPYSVLLALCIGPIMILIIEFIQKRRNRK